MDKNTNAMGTKKVMPLFDFHVCAAYDFYVDTSVI